MSKTKSKRLQEIIGVEIVDDIRLGHTWHEIQVLGQFVMDTQPLYFIEIGVHEGGMSYVLIPKLNVMYVGVEIDCSIIRPEVLKLYREYSALLFCRDCFDHDLFTMFQATRRKIIYCDGGNKAKEIAHFQSACRTGDIIMCHDYWDGQRKVRGVPDENISKEVLPLDVQIYENSTAWKRLPEEIFKETRIIGWIRL